MARGRRIILDSSDDELPDIRQIGSFQTKSSRDARPPPKQPEESANKGIVRRRKLGPISDGVLLRPAMGRGSSGTLFDDGDDNTLRERSTKPRRIELRTRRTKPSVRSFEVRESSEADSVQEETIIEDFSGVDESDFEASKSRDSEGDDSTDGLFLERSPPRLFKKIGSEPKARKVPRAKKRTPSPSAQLLAEAIEAHERDDTQESSSSKGIKSKSKAFLYRTEGSRGMMQTGPNGTFSDLRLCELQPPKPKRPSSGTQRPTTPPSPALKPKYKGLASPSKKINRIPATPHRPHTDTFWDQEFIDEWNDEHSPKKQLFSQPPPPPASQDQGRGRSQSPSKKSPTKKPPSQAAVAKAAKKAFEQSKHELADTFLRELDERVTDGKISELSASTGGVRIDWSNRLNTTAGRANWRRETTRRKDEGTGAVTEVTYRHHASIELAEKVIDDEGRLLNVIAHEFCHLANFMVSGVTNNPHGREFKGWAARVTRAFGDSRGIEVTTKHSYDIDFKYVWECTACGLEFKRHSKSINTERHRCGACKSELRQTKPVPRGRPAGESEYQRFMKEQMRVIRLENPGSPQKDIMKLVASRWSQRERDKERDKEDFGDEKPSGVPSFSSSSSCPSSQVTSGGKERFEGVAKSLTSLTLIDLT